MNKIELLDNIIKLRHYKTLISNFLDVEPDSDGRLRTSYSIKETGRLGSSEDELGEGTHLQNIPPKLRGMFIADRGMKLVEADKSQGEVRIVAWLAREERMKNVFKQEGDVHRKNASFIFNKDEADVTKSERYVAKRIVHASNYGMGEKKLAMIVNSRVYLTDEEAKERQDRYFNAFPKIRSWQGEVRQVLGKTRVLTNPFGRRRQFFGRLEWEFDQNRKPIKLKENETVREAYAFIPQSTLVDDVNRGMIEFWYKGEPRLQLLHQGHDSLLWQTKIEYIEWSIGLARECLQKPFVCGGDVLMIPIEVKVGENWGSMEEVK